MTENIFVIEGGNALKGEIEVSGSKNIATKVIIASLLVDGEVILKNVPRINDVLELIELIKKLGGKAEFNDKNTLIIDGRTITKTSLDLYTASKIRVSFMLFAPLLNKLQEAHIPNPGGCRLGARSIDRIIDGLSTFGATISYNSDTGYYDAIASDKKNHEFVFEKKSHTGTETLIMFAVLQKGEFIIDNAAKEPEVDHLITFLNSAGAKIKRVHNTIIISGADKLRSVEYTIPNDRNEAISYASLALSSKGDITISGILEDEIKIFIDYILKINGGYKKINSLKHRFYYDKKLLSSDVVTSEHPGFMTDWQPLWAILMTQASGISTITETMFENRFEYVDEFNKLGAHIEYLEFEPEDPAKTYAFNYDREKTYKQKIAIHGKKDLHGGILAAKDLRAGASLIIAALIAEGQSIVKNADIIMRGYDSIEQKIRSIGGNIQHK